MVIKILNLDKCIKKFEGYEKIDLMPVIKESARKVQRSARDTAPVDSGDLKRSIKTKHYPKQQSSVVYTTLEYASYVEFGTSKMAAQPYMRPALNRHRAGINQSIKKYLREQLRKV